MARKKSVSKTKARSKPKRQTKKRAASTRKTNAVTRFFRETIGELRKVSWPTWPDSLRMTKIVITVLAIMSALLGTLDLLYVRLFKLVFG